MAEDHVLFPQEIREAKSYKGSADWLIDVMYFHIRGFLEL